MQDIDAMFPNCPFIISCVDDLSELDTVFTTESVIFIHDDRASGWFYDDLPTEERSTYYNYTMVKATSSPITMRDVIHAMIADPHYHDEFVCNDPHTFLEQFEVSKKSKIQYSCFWGS